MAAVTVLAALVLPLSAVPTLSQDKKPDAAATETKPLLLDVSKVRAKTGRVPNGMGKLGLTKDQKERIYGIQEAYDSRIKALETELDQLKGEEPTQVQNVLSAPQQEAYKKYAETSTGRRAVK